MRFPQIRDFIPQETEELLKRFVRLPKRTASGPDVACQAQRCFLEWIEGHLADP
jgi:hypothetical protein